MRAIAQTDLFHSSPVPEQDYRPDPADVRSKMLAVLAKAKAAPAVPWPGSERALYRVVFPQMANWLPADEAARLRSEFAAELERLRAA